MSLSREEEIVLAREIQAAGDGGAPEAEAALINSCSNSFNFYANKYKSRGLSYEDLVAIVPLTRTFNPEASAVKFSTYVAKRISGSMVDALRHRNDRVVHITRGTIEDGVAVNDVVRSLAQEKGRKPTDVEVSHELDKTLGDVMRLGVFAKMMPNVSFDALAKNADGFIAHQFESAGDSVEDSLRKRDLAEYLLRILMHIPDQEQEVLQRYYGVGGDAGVFIKDVANDMRLSEVRIYVIRKSGLEHMREYLEGKIREGRVSGFDPL